MVSSYWNGAMIIDFIQRDKTREQVVITVRNRDIYHRTQLHCRKHEFAPDENLSVLHKERRQSKVCGLNKGLVCQRGQGGSGDIYHPADILPLSLLGRRICDSAWAASPVWRTALWQAVSRSQCTPGVGRAGGDKLCHFSQLLALTRKTSTAVCPLPFQSLHLHPAYDNQQLVSLINQHLLWP